MSIDNFEEMLDEAMPVRKGLSIGERVDAQVISIGKEYVFFDLGTRAEGLVPRAEFETEDGELRVKEGDTVSVVLAAMRDGVFMCAVRAGQRTLERDDDKSEMWAQLEMAAETGLPVEGVVKAVNKGGVEVDVMGLRGFCPVSQIERGFCADPSVHLNHAYTFRVTRCEPNARNLVLSRRALLEAEEKERAALAWQSLRVGDVRNGVVASLQPYGAFVRFDDLEGLLHVSEISYQRIQHPDEVLAVGQSIAVQVKTLDADKQKIGLSLKSLSPDPWDAFVAHTAAGAVLEGTVTRLVSFGAFVAVSDEVEGLVHISQLRVGQHVSHPREVVSVGAKVSVRVLEIDDAQRRISLSMVDVDKEEEAAIVSQFRETKSSVSMGTFGDLLKGVSGKQSRKNKS
ncbi:MAG: S1 RNA-binding domain-containing protein [Myxococcales bacterium]|jgi:small subunit ribosomal protein S1|nr:S1 RNA-binding domain-containing protein [Myxococcales bacterium]